MSRAFSPAMAAALLADTEKLEALGQDPGPTFADLYDGVECEACEDAPACATDINGINLCAECAEGCRIPRTDA